VVLFGFVVLIRIDRQLFQLFFFVCGQNFGFGFVMVFSVFLVLGLTMEARKFITVLERTQRVIIIFFLF